MTSPAPPTTLGVLVPDDEDLLDLLNLVDEPLMNQVCGPLGPDEHDLQLPAAVLDAALPDAWSRVWHAVNDTTAAARPRRMLAPDGRFEHVPLVLVALDSADLDRLQAVDAALQLAVGQADRTRSAPESALAEVLDQVADSWEHELQKRHDAQPGHADGAYLAGVLHRLLAVLDVSTMPEARPLLTRLAAAGAEDIVLTSDEESAYRQLAPQYCRLLAPRSPAIHALAYLGVPPH